MFDADLSGTVLNMSLLKRLMVWIAPYRSYLLISLLLVLISSALMILLPILISLVAIDHILLTDGSPNYYRFAE